MENTKKGMKIKLAALYSVLEDRCCDLVRWAGHYEGTGDNNQRLWYEGKYEGTKSVMNSLRHLFGDIVQPQAPNKAGGGE